MTPVHSKPVTLGDNDTFKELEQRRAAGTLGEGNAQPKAPVELPDFEEKSDDELAKLSKSDLIAYMKAKAAFDAAMAERERDDAISQARTAAVHKLPMTKKGSRLPLADNHPDHPGSGVPYPLHDDEGNVRMTADTARRKGGPVTRQDN